MAKLNGTPIQLPLQIEGATLAIPLTMGLVATVDAMDADLAQYRWWAQKHDAQVAYAVRSEMVEYKGSPIRMHRVIMSRMLNRELNADEQVDHISGDGLLNTRKNLRLVTQTENSYNRKLYATNTSGTRGVSWNKRIEKWAVHISRNRQRIHLGYFDNQDDAIAVRLAAEKEYFGEFAPSLSRDK